MQVPDLTGLDFEQAVTAVENFGMELRISPKSTFTTEQEEGHIYAQSPRANSWVKGRDEPIYLYVRVSKGTLQSAVPTERVVLNRSQRIEQVKDTPSEPPAALPAPTPEPEGAEGSGGDISELSSEATRNGD